MSGFADYPGALVEVHALHRVIAFIEFPIIQATKRNSKLYKGMCTNSRFRPNAVGRGTRARHIARGDGLANDPTGKC
jgi:hypothetical protein